MPLHRHTMTIMSYDQSFERSDFPIRAIGIVVLLGLQQ